MPRNARLCVFAVVSDNRYFLFSALATNHPLRSIVRTTLNEKTAPPPAYFIFVIKRARLSMAVRRFTHFFDTPYPPYRAKARQAGPGRTYQGTVGTVGTVSPFVP